MTPEIRTPETNNTGLYFDMKDVYAKIIEKYLSESPEDNSTLKPLIEKYNKKELSPEHDPEEEKKLRIDLINVIKQKAENENGRDTSALEKAAHDIDCVAFGVWSEPADSTNFVGNLDDIVKKAIKHVENEYLIKNSPTGGDTIAKTQHVDYAMLQQIYQQMNRALETTKEKSVTKFLESILGVKSSFSLMVLKEYAMRGDHHLYAKGVDPEDKIVTQHKKMFNAVDKFLLCIKTSENDITNKEIDRIFADLELETKDIFSNDEEKAVFKQILADEKARFNSLNKSDDGKEVAKYFKSDSYLENLMPRLKLLSQYSLLMKYNNSNFKESIKKYPDYLKFAGMLDDKGDFKAEIVGFEEFKKKLIAATKFIAIDSPEKRLAKGVSGKTTLGEFVKSVNGYLKDSLNKISDQADKDKFKTKLTKELKNLFGDDCFEFKEPAKEPSDEYINIKKPVDANKPVTVDEINKFISGLRDGVPLMPAPMVTPFSDKGVDNLVTTLEDPEFDPNKLSEQFNAYMHISAHSLLDRAVEAAILLMIFMHEAMVLRHIINQSKAAANDKFSNDHPDGTPVQREQFIHQCRINDLKAFSLTSKCGVLGKLVLTREMSKPRETGFIHSPVRLSNDKLPVVVTNTPVSEGKNPATTASGVDPDGTHNPAKNSHP